MNRIPTEFFGNEAQSCNGTGPTLGEDLRRRGKLPPLPDECRPQQIAGPIPRPADPEAKGEHSFATLLRSLVGRMVTIVDPESFEEAAVGHRIRAAVHQAELVRLGEDYLVLIGEFAHRSVGHHNGGTNGSIRHYIPLANIKRISILDNEPILHL